MDRRLSLEEIDGTPWGDPPPDATRLVATVHRLRRVPVGHLDAEGLRLLIGQQEGLDVLVPLAVEKLAVDPLAVTWPTPPSRSSGRRAR
jgi:hypothetical protein